MEMFPITDKEVFIKCMPWIKDIPFVDDMTAYDCLARCLTGQYQGEIGHKDGKPVMIVIFYIKGDSMFVVGVWGRKNFDGFPQEFFGRWKQNGIKVARACSVLDPEMFERKTTLKPKYTVFERTL